MHIVPANNQPHWYDALYAKSTGCISYRFGIFSTFVGSLDTSQPKWVKCGTNIKNTSSIIILHMQNVMVSWSSIVLLYVIQYHSCELLNFLPLGIFMSLVFPDTHASYLHDGMIWNATSSIFNISCKLSNWDWPCDLCCLPIMRLLSSQTDIFSLYPKQ